MYEGTIIFTYLNHLYAHAQEILFPTDSCNDLMSRSDNTSYSSAGVAVTLNVHRINGEFIDADELKDHICLKLMRTAGQLLDLLLSAHATNLFISFRKLLLLPKGHTYIVIIVITNNIEYFADVCACIPDHIPTVSS